MSTITRPKIFALTLDSPRMPGAGGEVRSYFFIKMLAAQGELTLVCCGGPSGLDRVSDEIAGLCHTVIEPGESWRRASGGQPSRLISWLRALVVLAFPWRNGWHDFYHYCMQYIKDGSRENDVRFQWRKKMLQSGLRMEYRLGARFFDMPCGLEFAYRDKFEALRQRACQALSSSTYSVIWYEHTYGYPFIKDLLDSTPIKGQPKLVCNAHNIEWLLYQRIHANSSARWDRDYAEMQSSILKRLETKQFASCSTVFVCSEEEKRVAVEIAPKGNFVVAGNGVDTKYFSPSQGIERTSSPTLLFTGSFGYQPNIEGLKFFVGEIFPLITECLPDCRFVFAGREAKRAYDNLRGLDDRIVCVSDPLDIRPCFEEAWMFVVPLLSGGGTRLKILEAMSMGCPVVSTRLGAEGIPAEDQRQILLADTADEFAEQVLRLAQDPLLRSQVAADAFGWVRQRYDWSMITSNARDYLAQ